MSIRDWIDHVLLCGYDAEKAAGIGKIVSRYARGNIATQDGAFMKEDSLARLRARGDEAMLRLEKLIPAS